MTREEAIKIFNTVLFFGKCDCPKEEIEECLNMAIKALEQEPCNDCISREKALELAENSYHLAETMEDLAWLHENNLKALPSVQPKQKTGHWIRITNGAMKEKYICSECGRQIEDGGIESLLPIKYPYCHCGAKMDKEDEE